MDAGRKPSTPSMATPETIGYCQPVKVHPKE